jgi:hypothetical protein
MALKRMDNVGIVVEDQSRTLRTKQLLGLTGSTGSIRSRRSQLSS